MVMMIPLPWRGIENSLQKLSCRYFFINHTHQPLLRHCNGVGEAHTTPWLLSYHPIDLLYVGSEDVWSKSPYCRRLLSIERWLVHHIWGGWISSSEVDSRSLEDQILPLDGTTIYLSHLYTVINIRIWCGMLWRFYGGARSSLLESGWWLVDVVTLLLC